jgi:hypothetical protein
VAGRIQHDTPSSGPRLFIGPAGTQSDGLRLGCVQIGDREIEMHLLRDRAARPGRRLVIGYPQCRNRGAMASHHDDIVAYRRHFAAEEPRPERCETSRVLTIEADQSQASQCHGTMLTPTPQRQPTYWAVGLSAPSSVRSGKADRTYKCNHPGIPMYL